MKAAHVAVARRRVQEIRVSREKRARCGAPVLGEGCRDGIPQPSESGQQTKDGNAGLRAHVDLAVGDHGGDKFVIGEIIPSVRRLIAVI
jgi:hypothetical protein